jgi:hypothetical protein
MGDAAAVATQNGIRLVLAVFDDWSALRSILIATQSDAAMRPAAVLHARNDVPPEIAALHPLKEMIQLRFARSGKPIACTVGELANALSGRLATGAQSLADALDDWLGSNQAKQLEHHLERGRLLLCVALRTSEDFSVVCGKLVQASPHVVELCNTGIRREGQEADRSAHARRRLRPGPLDPGNSR